MVTRALDETGIPAASADADVEAPTTVRIDIETADGSKVFQTTVELRRRSSTSRRWRR